MYEIETKENGKNKMFFTVNGHEITVLKDKSWSPGFVKIIIENGKMFPCVLEIREDPPEFSTDDVEKIVDHIDKFYVKETGLNPEIWAVCNRIEYLRSIFKDKDIEEVEQILGYYAISSDNDEITIPFISSEKKNGILLHLRRRDFQIVVLNNDKKEIKIEADYNNADALSIFESLDEKYKMRLADYD